MSGFSYLGKERASALARERRGGAMFGSPHPSIVLPDPEQARPRSAPGCIQDIAPFDVTSRTLVSGFPRESHARSGLRQLPNATHSLVT